MHAATGPSARVGRAARASPTGSPHRPGGQAGAILTHAQALLDATATAQCREIEAAAAIIYFGAWTDRAQATFAKADRMAVPAHWLRYTGRRSPLDAGRSPRKAADPINALLNYA